MLNPTIKRELIQRIDDPDILNSLVEKSIKESNDPKALATSILAFCIEEWQSQNNIDEKTSKKLEKIVLFLMDKGAKVSEKTVGNAEPRYMESPQIGFMIQHNMFNALKHESVRKAFSNLGFSPQRHISAGAYESDKVDAFKILLSYLDRTKILREIHPGEQVSPHFGNKFTAQGFLSELNNAVPPEGLQALWKDSDKKRHFDAVMDMWGHILKLNLLAFVRGEKGDRSFLQKAPDLKFNDPQTNKPYKLEKFIQDNPSLKEGWNNPVKDITEEVSLDRGRSKSVGPARDLQERTHRRGYSAASRIEREGGKLETKERGRKKP